MIGRICLVVLMHFLSACLSFDWSPPAALPGDAPGGGDGAGDADRPSCLTSAEPAHIVALMRPASPRAPALRAAMQLAAEHVNVHGGLLGGSCLHIDYLDIDSDHVLSSLWVALDQKD